MSYTVKDYTPKQRMINAYKGIFSDRYPVAPEFWFYYPAKLLGVDMITLERELPFWQSLQETFKYFNCEGWGIVSPHYPNPEVDQKEQLVRLEEGRYESRKEITTRYGKIYSRTLFSTDEPSWITERPIKDLGKDWKVYKLYSMPPVEFADYTEIEKALRSVGDDYLLEVYIGDPFFDYVATAREGGLEQAIWDFNWYEDFFLSLRAEYEDWMCQKTEDICRRTSVESLFIGCSWACNSLEGPRMWRKWDKPLIKKLVKIVHKYGRLLHVHFHGKCMETLKDFVELGIDCVCPFERPPGGDVTDLNRVRRILNGKVTMNGNVHTVETLIRGTPRDVEREVIEIIEAFRGEPRLIVGTGDQVGKETPEENIWAMIETVKKYVHVNS
ncbi:hypothetical protein J7M02_07590 [Candidatus Aerophobetes bacterium]|nr:hypothetical protein [Candidatus Aerophobetes bacterium]